MMKQRAVKCSEKPRSKAGGIAWWESACLVYGAQVQSLMVKKRKRKKRRKRKKNPIPPMMVLYKSLLYYY
jgi:hypothetical protein